MARAADRILNAPSNVTPMILKSSPCCRRLWRTWKDSLLASNATWLARPHACSSDCAARGSSRIFSTCVASARVVLYPFHALWSSAKTVSENPVWQLPGSHLRSMHSKAEGQAPCLGRRCLSKALLETAGRLLPLLTSGLRASCEEIRIRPHASPGEPASGTCVPLRPCQRPR